MLSVQARTAIRQRKTIMTDRKRVNQHEYDVCHLRMVDIYLYRCIGNVDPLRKVKDDDDYYDYDD